MTLTQLRNAVRAMVTDDVTTFVRLTVADYDHMQNNPQVTVSISCLRGGCFCEQVEAGTAEGVLELFRIEVMPLLNPPTASDTADRLAAMDVNTPIAAAALRAYELCEGLADGAPDAPEYAKEAGRVAEELWAAIEKAGQ